MRLVCLAAGLAAALVSIPAAAQVAVESSVHSDYRLRGYSLTDEHPVAAVTLAYDDPSGLYLAATAIGMVRDGDPELFSVQGSIGYARRISPQLSAEAGVYHTEYFSGYGTGRNYDYTEIYAGLATRTVAARVRYSPNYFREDNPTLYGEIDAGKEIAPQWLASAHAGVLHYLDQPRYSARTRYDWRLGLSRQLGRLGLHLDLTGRIVEARDLGYPLPPALARASRDKVAVVASLTRAF